MQADLSKRFGNLSGGVTDIKSHAWFKTLDWEACLTKRMSAPIKYVSTVGPSQPFLHAPRAATHAEWIVVGSSSIALCKGIMS